jgi:hypothetical protein
MSAKQMNSSPLSGIFKAATGGDLPDADGPGYVSLNGGFGETIGG